MRRRERRKKKSQICFEDESTALQPVRKFEDRPTEGKWYVETRRWVLSFPNARTRANCSVAVRKLDAFLLSRGVNLDAPTSIEVTKEHMKIYYEHLREAYVARTQKQYCRRLQSMFKFIGLPDHYFRLDESFALRVPLKKKMTDDQLHALWVAASKESKVLLSLLIAFRLSVKDILKLRKEDVSADEEHVIVHCGEKQKKHKIWNYDGEVDRYSRSLSKWALDRHGPCFERGGKAVCKRQIYKMIGHVRIKAGMQDVKILPNDFSCVKA